MNTIHTANKKLLAAVGVAAAAVATPAVLLAAAGTAQADAIPGHQSNGVITVDYSSNPRV